MSTSTETRKWGEPEPVRVFIKADVSPFVEALNVAAASFARFAETWTPQSRAIRHIRAIAADERLAAFDWLDHHLDEVYASLDIPRDPHITRGEN